MTPPVHPTEPTSLFDDDLIQQWYERIGAFNPVGQNATRRVYRAGAEGAARYRPALSITGLNGVEDFAEIVFWRPLSVICAFAALRTPYVMTRNDTTEPAGLPSEVIVGTQSLPALGAITHHGASANYRGFDFLGAIDTTDEFTFTSFSISDPVGVWIPAALLTDGVASITPRVCATPLARSAAAFLRNFALEVAVRGAHTDVEAEMAAIDVVRSALRNTSDDSRHGTSGAPARFIQEATLSMIEQHYRDPGFTVDVIARNLHVSRRHLYRMFADTTESPAGIIARRRLERARTLLTSPSDTPIDRVAAASGFTSGAALRNRFRAEYGLTPDQFRRTHTAPTRRDR